ncbi:MAG TPA: hypothetical protein VFA94_13230 [Acidimicrobiales bacterium]|nr:hypothetical protein [Acidimicrobiales bacterium]
MTDPRLLAIMGSGETSPTMVKTHRSLLDRVSPPAVLLDTPSGFQENSGDIAAKAVDYFRESVGAAIEVVTFRSAQVDPLDRETAVARLRSAGYVFSGPGSPSYALRQWRGSPVPSVLEDKVRPGGAGGCVTFASAAALTLGVVTVPVYEIYKVGEDPVWLEGLDLLAAATGLRAAVIPHYNNAEGGNHDTRYCYLGERRLQLLESALPDGAFVLGVDEHTGLVLDLDAGRASVVGLGVVTVRRDGQSTELPAGTQVGIEALASGPGTASGAAPSPAAAPMQPATRSPLLDTVARLDAEFAAALADGDAGEAVRAVLALDEELVAWSRDTLQSDEMDRARSVLRSMVVRLGELAATGTKDPAEAVGPFVDALLQQRAAARDGKRWADADAVRDRLVALGVEVNDGPEGTSWRLLS